MGPFIYCDIEKSDMSIVDVRGSQLILYESNLFFFFFGIADGSFFTRESEKAFTMVLIFTFPSFITLGYMKLKLCCKRCLAGRQFRFSQVLFSPYRCLRKNSMIETDRS